MDNATIRKTAKRLADEAAKRCANKEDRLNMSAAVHDAVTKALTEARSALG